MSYSKHRHVSRWSTHRCGIGRQSSLSRVSGRAPGMLRYETWMLAEWLFSKLPRSNVICECCIDIDHAPLLKLISTPCSGVGMLFFLYLAQQASRREARVSARTQTNSSDSPEMRPSRLQLDDQYAFTAAQDVGGHSAGDLGSEVHGDRCDLVFESACIHR